MKQLMLWLALGGILFSANAHSDKRVLVSDTITLFDNNVDYKVTTTKSHIAVNITTADTKTIMAMLHHGVTVFFDLKGKEKENVSVKYPLEPLRLPRKSQGERSDDFQSEAEINQLKANINKLIITDFPEEAEFKFFNTKEQFNVLINSLGIKALYKYNEKTGALTYQLSIPKHKLKEKAKNDFSKLEIGVKTVMPERSENGNRPENVEGGRGGGNGPSGGGGRGSGGGPGGGRGGGSQGQQRPNNADTKMPSGIDFWFEAHI